MPIPLRAKEPSVGLFSMVDLVGVILQCNAR
jgi:hypothetical protein